MKKKFLTSVFAYSIKTEIKETSKCSVLVDVWKMDFSSCSSSSFII